jgi:hypothetical protein
MPNWCTNILTVTGSAETLTRFRDQAKDPTRDTDLSLNKFCPVPKGEAFGGYYWCTRNWGCKWDVQAKLKVAAGDRLEYEFVSAWSPPVAWLKVVSRNFPLLEFWLKYEESEQGFRGTTWAQEGFIDDKSSEYE